MKRFFILSLVIFAILIGGNVFADKAVLIDFSLLGTDYPSDDPSENSRTMIDYSDKAGSVFTDEERAIMKTSLAIPNWEIQLASSSRTQSNMLLSEVKEVSVRDEAKKYAGEKILGARIHFPLDNYNSWAEIKPPFEIPLYAKMTELQDDGTLVEDPDDRECSKFCDGYGVVKNVGVIKSISVTAYGSNFPVGLEVLYRDQNNDRYTVFMGYLNFEGWRTITWDNPNYIDDVKNRSLVAKPLYPDSVPMVKFDGFRINRDGAQDGGDCLVYVKDVNIVYDKASLELERDIDEEAVWGIITEREEAKKRAEYEKLGKKSILRYIEKQKMNVDEEEIEENPSEN